MSKQNIYTIALQSDDWKGALTATIFSLVLSAAGNEVDGETLDLVRTVFDEAHQRGWEFTSDDMIAYCLTPTRTVDDLRNIAGAIESVSGMDEKIFTHVLNEVGAKYVDGEGPEGSTENGK